MDEELFRRLDESVRLYERNHDITSDQVQRTLLELAMVLANEEGAQQQREMDYGST